MRNTSLSLAILSAFFLMAGLNNLSAQRWTEFGGVNNRRGNPSPPETSSNLNDYRFQDEQLNVAPDSGVVKVLRTNQKNLINDFVTELIPVNNVSVRELRDMFRIVCGIEGGRAEVVRDKNTKNYWVQVICPRFQLDYIRAAIQALDQDWLTYKRNGTGEFYYKAKFRDVHAVDNLAHLWGSAGVSQIDLANNAVYRWGEPYRLEGYLTKGVPLVDIPANQVLLDLKIYEIDTGNDAKLGLDYIAWKNGPGRNLFEFILAGMDNHERFTNLSSIFNPIDPRIVNPGPRDLRLVREYTADGVVGYANYLVTAAYLDFLAVKGKAKVLADTQILGISGQGRSAGTRPALFEAVDEVVAFNADPGDPGVDEGFGARPARLVTTAGELLLTSQQSGNPTFDGSGNPRYFTYFMVNDDGTTSPRIFEVDTAVHNRTLRYDISGKVGIFLEVIPHVGLETCELEIQAGASTIAGYAPNGLPMLSQRTVETRVRAQSGQPIVLTGLSREAKIKSKAGMPVLGKIPIVGYLAGGETKVNRKTDVIFVLTPTIITGTESSITMSDQSRETVALAKGQGRLDPPQNPMGFDQWLFDREAPAP